MTMTAELDARREALAKCLERLPLRDRELVMTRYERGAGVEEAARRNLKLFPETKAGCVSAS
jgi:DNA-directed RNA polymerase specialized sigma24 family protein